MLDEKINKFLEEKGPVFYVTPTVGRAIGLETTLPGFHIVCAQTSDAVELLRRAGVKVFCLEKDIKNSGKLLAQAEVITYIKQAAADKKANILTFKPGPMIEKVCEKNSFRYLGNPSWINRGWEDKLKFAQITNALGIPNAESRVLKIEERVPETALDFLHGQRYVVQFARGYSGNSTFLVEKKSEFESIIKNNVGRKIKISAFKAGDTYTFDVCIGKFGILISQPIFQITGFGEFNRNSLGTCGNDFAYGKKLSEEIKSELTSCIQKVADKLFAEGYRGILGFDFVVDQNELNLIEVNPRLVGSVPVLTKLQLAAGETPFLLLHVLSFLDYDFGDMSIPKPGQDFEFSQIILRNSSAGSQFLEKGLDSGIYKWGQEGIVFKKEAYFADEKLAADEFFLECAPAGATIDPDVEYANIQFGCGIMKTGNSFEDNFLKIKDEVFRNIIIR